MRSITRTPPEWQQAATPSASPPGATPLCSPTSPTLALSRPRIRITSTAHVRCRSERASTSNPAFPSPGRASFAWRAFLFSKIDTSMPFTEQYDVVIVGAGHADCEAAMAAARMGLRTALYTFNLDLIAQMSCNPAIGGIAKGHLVREVDALGGIMGEVADAVGIQFRLLNTSRGPAVWSPRAQCDKQAYRLKMREVLECQSNLKLKQAEVADLFGDTPRGSRLPPNEAPNDPESQKRKAESRVLGIRLRDGRTV